MMLRWIREHKFIFITLIVVLLVIITFIVSLVVHDKNEDGSFINSGNGVISEFTTKVTNGIENTVYGFFNYRQLEKQIAELKTENLSLKMELNEALLSREELEQLQDLSSELNYEYVTQKFDLISASVTYYDGANFTSMFTINIGTEDGVEIGDPVINGQGLVGKITQVGDNWAKVSAICDDSSKISFKVVRDRKQLGVVEGTSQKDLEGFMMDAESTVQEGDILITSGLGTYPEGIEIGVIKSISYNKSTLLREIEVETSVDFDRIDKVSVIKHYIVKNTDDNIEKSEKN